MSEIISLQMDARVRGSYDVVVCGGGTAGVIAALAAARGGAKTLLLESGYFLGGMMTMGNAGITKSVMHGKDYEEQYRINNELDTAPEKVQIVGGIPLEIINRMIKEKTAIGNHGTGASYVYPDNHKFKLLLFDLLHEAGAEVFLHAKVVKTLMKDSKIEGVVFDTKSGLEIAYGKYVIDCTGDGDVAALSNAEFVLGACESDLVVKRGLAPVGRTEQPGAMYKIGGVDFDRFFKHCKDNPDLFIPHTFGLMGMEEFIESYEKGEAIEPFIIINRETGRRVQIYNNVREGVAIGCIGFVFKDGFADLTDGKTLSEAEYELLKTSEIHFANLKNNLPGFENAYILDVPQIGVRETRHIMGEYVLTLGDILVNRDFEDSIGFSSHPIDIDPVPDEYINREIPDRAYFRIPYRTLVVKGIDNLFMAGRHTSATREASGCTRITVACMEMGEAVGTAAAILSRGEQIKAKDIDIKLLRDTLKKNGVKC